MWWYYKLLSDDGKVVCYSYSRENDLCDGIITYDRFSKTTSMVMASGADKGSAVRMERAIDHFGTIVREGFPAVRRVCCG